MVFRTKEYLVTFVLILLLRCTMSSKKKSVDSYLAEIFKQFIAIKDDDYKKSKEVFDGVFEQIKAKMGEQCNYFKKYGSQFMYAGSVADGIKVSKLDEFDMDLVIRLPISYEHILLEPDQPGFVKLKIESAFDNLDKQQEWEKCHKVTRDWRDSDKYFLQSKFRQWVHGIVQKALNEMNHQILVNDVPYTLKYKESGPAWTLNIQNEDSGFKLDVDLVPVIRFMYPRWPEGYRTLEDCTVKEWLVVPKPNKGLSDEAKNRCWRLSFQDFEREFIKGCQALKTTIRLLKKLRDSQQMKDIASYYIKTVFLWRVDKEKDKKYWYKPISVIFRVMVEDLYNALSNRNIPYFWHEDNNLIQNVKPTVLKGYTDKLKEVLDAMDTNNPEKLATMLLTTNEFQEFKKSEFYINIKNQQAQKRCPSPSILSLPPSFSHQESCSSVTDSQKTDDSTLAELIKALADKIETMNGDSEKRMKKIEADLKASNKNKPLMDMIKNLDEKLDNFITKYNEKDIELKKIEKETKTEKEKERLENKIDTLIDKLDAQEEKMITLEMALKGMESNTKSKLVFQNDRLDGHLASAGEMVLNLIAE